VNFSLKDSNGESNIVTTHYVLAGDSATIQSLSLDKDYYAKGDIANLTLLWAPRADAFPHNRLGTKVTETSINIFATITNKYGRSCAEPVNEQLPQSMNGAKTDIPLSIISECINPQLSVALSDKDGNILDKKEFSFESTTTPEVEPLKSVIFIIIIVILLIIILVAMYLKKNKNKSEGSNITGNTITMGMLILALLFGMRGTEKVIALDEFGGNERPSASLVTNIDKDTYNVGENMTATGTAVLGQCANAVDIFTLSVNIDGGFTYTIVDRNLDEQVIYGSQLIRVPTTAGIHTVRFTLQVDGGSIEQTKTFRVIANPVPNLEVNRSTNPTAVNIDSDVDVRWSPEESKSCSCTCYNESGSVIRCGDSGSTSCGSGVGSPQFSTPYPIPKLQQKTVFKVSCLGYTSLDFPPPTTTTTTVLGEVTAL